MIGIKLVMGTFILAKTMGTRMTPMAAAVPYGEPFPCPFPAYQPTSPTRRPTNVPSRRAA